MTPEEERSLSQFLTTFDVTGLGEGDLNAGVNTLAAMLITLANIARPGSGILCNDRKLAHVGSNLLVSGSLSSSLITDEVVTELRVRQNNLTSHLEQVRAIKKKEDNDNYPRRRNFAELSKTNRSSESLFSLLGQSSSSLLPTNNAWASVVGSPPNPDFTDLTSDSKIVIAASHPTKLREQLTRTHQGCPLVLLALNRSFGTEHAADLCSAVMNGHFPDATEGKIIKGNLLIIDPNDTLHELAQADGEQVAWMGNTVWLVDGNAGPEVPDYEASKPPIGNIPELFKNALSLGFGKRLNHHDAYPVTHNLNFTQAQLRWVAFLKGMEDILPGISGSARSLLASLVFGVLELTSQQKKPSRTPNPLFGIEDFAQLLIRRMANARCAMMYSSQDARNCRIQESILLKLESGPHTIRTLTRRFNRLTCDPCLELLLDLKKQGLVIHTDNQWQLSEVSNSSTSSLTLEA